MNNTDKGVNDLEALRIFYNPSKATKNLLERDKFPAGMLCLMLLYPSVTYLLNYQSIWAESFKQIKTTYDMMGLSMEISQIATMTTWGLIAALAGTCIFGVLGWLVFSLLYKLSLNFSETKYSYKSFASVAAYANLITVLETVIIAVLMMTGSKITSFSPALFLNAETANLTVYTLLASFDIFRIWKYVVLGIGAYHASGKRKKGFINVAVIFIVITLITVGRTALSVGMASRMGQSF